MALALRRVDLSPDDYVHVPQAPRVERRPILTRGPDNEWHMWGVYGVNEAGERVGLSNHTWSHVDAPYHLLPDGATFDRLDPARYLASRARLVDLTGTDERHETIDGVDYHSRIDLADLPDLDGYDAVLFVTGFAALYARGYPMTPGADAHYPNITRAAAERLTRYDALRLVGIDGPSVDKPETNAIAHRLLLGRQPQPVLLLETLTFERLRARGGRLPTEMLLTVEPMRAFGRDPDGALASVYAWMPDAGAEEEFLAFVEAMRTARIE